MIFDQFEAVHNIALWFAWQRQCPHATMLKLIHSIVEARLKQNVLFYVQQHRQQKNLPLGGFSGKFASFVPQGAFLLQKPPLFQSKVWIEKFTRKGA